MPDTDFTRLIDMLKHKEQVSAQAREEGLAKCTEMLEDISPISLAKYKKLVDHQNKLYKEYKASAARLTTEYFSLIPEGFREEHNKWNTGPFDYQGFFDKWLKTKGIEREI